MKKIVVCLTSIVIMIMCFTACGNKAENTNKNEEAMDNKDTLVVAMELAYPPFETKNEDGNPTGISVDIAKAFAEYIGKDIEIQNTAWDGLIPSLDTGKADMVISSMTITEEREKSVDFSEHYANSLLGILANIDSGITSVEDLNSEDKTVAVKIGSTGYFYAKENLKDTKITALPDESACVTEVIQGKADAFFYDQLTIYRNQQNNPDTTVAIYVPFQDSEKWGVAVKKGNTELLNQINEFIEEYKEDGGFDSLSEKYLSEEKKAFDELGFKWFFDLND